MLLHTRTNTHSLTPPHTHTTKTTTTRKKSKTKNKKKSTCFVSLPETATLVAKKCVTSLCLAEIVTLSLLAEYKVCCSLSANALREVPEFPGSIPAGTTCLLIEFLSLIVNFDWRQTDRQTEPITRKRTRTHRPDTNLEYYYRFRLICEI